MPSRMHLVQNAARLAMADHRAAGPLAPRPMARSLIGTVAAFFASLLSRRISAAD